MGLHNALAAKSVGELMQALDGALPAVADLPEPCLLRSIWTLPVQLATTDPSLGNYEWRSSPFTSSGFPSLMVLVAYRAAREGPV